MNGVVSLRRQLQCNCFLLRLTSERSNFLCHHFFFEEFFFQLQKIKKFKTVRNESCNTSAIVFILKTFFSIHRVIYKDYLSSLKKSATPLTIQQAVCNFFLPFSINVFSTSLHHQKMQHNYNYYINFIYSKIFINPCKSM